MTEIVEYERDSSSWVNGVDYHRTVKTLYEDEDGEVREEVFNGVLFFHAEVYNFSPSVYRKIGKVWEDLKNQAKEVGWDFVHAYLENEKFAQKLGGERLATVVGLDGKEYGVYRWQLKP